MNNSVGTAIEKIKMQEQDNETKLKERREYEATSSSLQRAIRETMQQVEKSEHELKQLKANVNSLRLDVWLARAKRDALQTQIETCVHELDKLRSVSDQSIKNVWETRSSLCNAVQEVADNFDIRALLIKPMQSDEIPSSPIKQVTEVYSEQLSVNKNRLTAAVERKRNALLERDRLTNEPDTGEDFLRIKNALQYSFEMIKSLNSD